MNRRQAIVGLGMLCALAFSAFAAQSASAAGTTAYTCKQTGTGFTDAHCKTAGSGSFGHVAIGPTTSTEVSGSNETTGGATEPLTLRTTITGIELELKATGVIIGGWMENREIGGEMVVEGEGGALSPEFTGVTVTKPAGKGCKVNKDAEGGVGIGEFVEGNNTKATTQGQGDAVKFTPAFEKPFATFFIQGCSIAGLNKTYAVVGNIKGTPNGATINFTHANTTEQGTLRIGSVEGPKAGIQGSITFKGRPFHFPPSGEYTALSATT